VSEVDIVLITAQGYRPVNHSGEVYGTALSSVKEVQYEEALMMFVTFGQERRVHVNRVSPVNALKNEK
jgi:hypothetical protein